MSMPNGCSDPPAGAEDDADEYCPACGVECRPQDQCVLPNGKDVCDTCYEDELCSLCTKLCGQRQAVLDYIKEQRELRNAHLIKDIALDHIKDIIQGNEGDE